MGCKEYFTIYRTYQPGVPQIAPRHSLFEMPGKVLVEYRINNFPNSLVSRGLEGVQPPTVPLTGIKF